MCGSYSMGDPLHLLIILGVIVLILIILFLMHYRTLNREGLLSPAERKRKLARAKRKKELKTQQVLLGTPLNSTNDINLAMDEANGLMMSTPESLKCSTVKYSDAPPSNLSWNYDMDVFSYRDRTRSESDSPEKSQQTLPI